MWFLAHLSAIERSPNTVRAYAHDLRDFFEFVAGRDVGWDRVRLKDIGRFVSWLCLPSAAGYMLGFFVGAFAGTSRSPTRAPMHGLCSRRPISSTDLAAQTCCDELTRTYGQRRERQQ